MRVLVVFGAQSVGELTEGGRAVFYTWGNQEEPGTTFRSHVSDLIVVHVLRSAGDADGDWRTETRRPFEDYLDFLGREPRAIRALGFLPNTDQTGATAVAELGAVRWCPTREEGPLPSAAAGSSEPQG